MAWPECAEEQRDGERGDAAPSASTTRRPQGFPLARRRFSSSSSHPQPETAAARASDSVAGGEQPASFLPSASVLSLLLRVIRRVTPPSGLFVALASSSYGPEKKTRGRVVPPRAIIRHRVRQCSSSSRHGSAPATRRLLRKQNEKSAAGRGSLSRDAKHTCSLESYSSRVNVCMVSKGESVHGVTRRFYVSKRLAITPSPDSEIFTVPVQCRQSTSFPLLTKHRLQRSQFSLPSTSL